MPVADANSELAKRLEITVERREPAGGNHRL
jgi:hypothetical protein